MLLSIQLITFFTFVTSGSGDFLGPRSPAPTSCTTNDSLIGASRRNLTEVSDTYLEGNHNTAPKLLAGLENLTFSIRMFSTNDPTAQSLRYHDTSEDVKSGPG